jgi:hypothetical protein
MLCDGRGPLNDLHDKLAGEAGDEWLGALKRFLRRESVWSTVPRMFLGQFSDYDEALKTLKAAGRGTLNWANQMLHLVNWESEARKLFEPVLIEDIKLGFDRPYRTEEMVERVAQSDMWRLCPAQVAALVAILYTDQPIGEYIPVCTTPFYPMNDHEAMVFILYRDECDFWLTGGRTANGATHWPVGTRWLVGKNL